MCLLTRSSRLQPQRSNVIDIRDVITEDLATLFDTKTWQNTVYAVVKGILFIHQSSCVTPSKHYIIKTFNGPLNKFGEISSVITIIMVGKGKRVRYHRNKGTSGIMPPEKRVIRKS